MTHRVLASLALFVFTALAQADPLPPTRLLCSFDYQGMLGRMKQQPLLANVSEDQYGSPVIVRVTHSLLPTTGGQAGGLLSAVLTGGTLGLIPAVTNNDLVVTYDVFVNDSLLASYEYRNNFTRVANIYAKDKTGGLGEDGQKWALDTASAFAADLQRNPAVTALIAEYAYYFKTATPPR